MSIATVNATLVNYEYPCCPSEPWPAILYDFVLTRANAYYTNFYLWPMMLVTFGSFGAFFMSPDVRALPLPARCTVAGRHTRRAHAPRTRAHHQLHDTDARWAERSRRITPFATSQVGERLGYGITLVLTVEFGKVIFHEQLPICGELLWIEFFNTICLSFCYISLFESIIVLYLACCGLTMLYLSRCCAAMVRPPSRPLVRPLVVRRALDGLVRRAGATRVSSRSSPCTFWNAVNTCCFTSVL